MPWKYEDFELSLTPGGSDGGCVCRLLTSPAGEATELIQLPFTQSEVSDIYDGLQPGSTSYEVRGRYLKEVGRKLFEALFSGQVGAQFTRSLDKVGAAQNSGLRIRLRIDPQLGASGFPWEAMWSPNLNNFLNLSPRTPIIRHVELPVSRQPLLVTLPLRILVIVSAPKDVPFLDGDNEWSKLDKALEELQNRGLVKLDRLRTADIGQLDSAVDAIQPHVIHFIGHGEIDEKEAAPCLLFEAPNGDSVKVYGEELAVVFQECNSLRLAVLNSCLGGAPSGNEFYASSMASVLISGGLPAVVAMQDAISDPSATVFAEDLYTALSRGEPVEAAVAAGRRRIYFKTSKIEWIIPSVSLRARETGLLFLTEDSAADRSEIGTEIQRGAKRELTGTSRGGAAATTIDFVSRTVSRSFLIPAATSVFIGSFVSNLIIGSFRDIHNSVEIFGPRIITSIQEVIIFFVYILMLVPLFAKYGWKPTLGSGIGLALGAALAVIGAHLEYYTASTGNITVSPISTIIGWMCALLAVQLVLVGGRSIGKWVERKRRQARRFLWVRRRRARKSWPCQQIDSQQVSGVRRRLRYEGVRRRLRYEGVRKKY